MDSIHRKMAIEDIESRLVPIRKSILANKDIPRIEIPEAYYRMALFEVEHYAATMRKYAEATDGGPFNKRYTVALEVAETYLDNIAMEYDSLQYGRGRNEMI